MYHAYSTSTRGRCSSAVATETGNGKIEKAPHAGAVFGVDWQPGLGGLGGSEDGPLDEVHVFWLAGMSCDGCSISVTGATSPSVEQLLPGSIPGLPTAVLHHPVLSIGAGSEFVRPFTAAADGTLGTPDFGMI